MSITRYLSPPNIRRTRLWEGPIRCRWATDAMLHHLRLTAPPPCALTNPPRPWPRPRANRYLKEFLNMHTDEMPAISPGSTSPARATGAKRSFRSVRGRGRLGALSPSAA
jgi:hypothetical protein